MKRTEWMVVKPRIGRPPKRPPLPPELQALADEFAVRIEQEVARASVMAVVSVLETQRRVLTKGTT